MTIFKTPPRPYQLAAVKWLVKRKEPYAAVLFEPRTGKTKVTIDYVTYLYKKHSIRRVLIVCPVRAFSVWEKEVAIHSAAPADVIFADKDNRKFLPLMAPDKVTYLLINYDAFASPSRARVGQLVRKFDADLMVLDESHRIKRPASIAGRAIRLIGKDVPRRMILTGTVITKAKAFSDIYGQWTFLNPDIRQQWPSHKDWKEHFGVWSTRKGYPQLMKLKNVGELKALIARDSIRVRRDDVLDVVPIKKKVLRFQLKESEEMYRQMADDMVAWLDEKAYSSSSIKLTQLVRLSQATSGFLPDDVTGDLYEIGTEKLRALHRLVDRIGPDEKVVVAARFRHDLDAISGSFDCPSWILQGGQSPAASGAILEAFKTAPAPAILVVQPQTASLAIDLSTARHLIWFSYTYSWSDYSQCSDRIALNPDGPTVWHLIAKGTMDEHSLAHLTSDGEYFREVLSHPRLLAYLPDNRR